MRGVSDGDLESFVRTQIATTIRTASVDNEIMCLSIGGGALLRF